MSDSRVKRAFERNDKIAIQKLLNDKNIDRTRLFQIAAYYGNDQVVAKLLQDWTVDPAAQNYMAMRAAAYNGHTGIIMMLANNSRATSEWALHLAYDDALRQEHLETANAINWLLSKYN